MVPQYCNHTFVLPHNHLIFAVFDLKMLLYFIGKIKMNTRGF